MVGAQSDAVKQGLDYGGQPLVLKQRLACGARTGSLDALLSPGTSCVIAKAG